MKISKLKFSGPSGQQNVIFDILILGTLRSTVSIQHNYIISVYYGLPSRTGTHYRYLMRIPSHASDHAALQALGRRLARHRLNRNLTQAALAAQAGVSTLTVQRIEQGRSSQAANLIRILRAHGLLDNLDALVPEPAISPVQQARMRGRIRQRASSRSGKPEPPTDWSWGDEP